MAAASQAMRLGRLAVRVAAAARLAGGPAGDVVAAEVAAELLILGHLTAAPFVCAVLHCFSPPFGAEALRSWR